MVKKTDKMRRRNRAIWIGAIVGGINLSLSVILGHLFFQGSYDISSLFFLLIVFIFSGAIVGIVLNFLFNKMNPKLLLTVAFLIGVFMGLLGIPPFGIGTIIGDVALPTPTILIILSALPLFFVLWIINLLGINILAREHVWQWAVIILTTVVYYYYISKIVIKLSKKGRGEKKGKWTQ